MTIEEINTLTDEQLIAMIGGEPTPGEILAYKNDLIAKKEKRLAVEAKFKSFDDFAHAFHSLYDIPNRALWLKQMREDYDAFDLELDALKIKDDELKAEKLAKEQLRLDKKARLDAFKAADKTKVTLKDLVDIVTDLVE